MDEELSSLIGIPWLLGGRTRYGCDCLGLALMAQRDLFGRVITDRWQYDGGDFLAMSLRFPDEMLDLGFREIDKPKDGDVGYLRIAGAGHLATFISGAHLTITQYTSSTWKVRKVPFRWFRPGVTAWQ